MIERLSAGHADSVARQELSSVTHTLRHGDAQLADTLVSDSGGSTRAFLMNMIA
jgi:hypothetical protein